MEVLVVTAEMIAEAILICQLVAAVAAGMAAMVGTLRKLDTQVRLPAAAVAADILDKEVTAFTTAAAVAADCLLTVGVRKIPAQMYGMVVEEPGYRMRPMATVPPAASTSCITRRIDR